MLLDATKTEVQFSELLDNRKYYFVIVDPELQEETTQELVEFFHEVVQTKDNLPALYACDTVAERDQAVKIFLELSGGEELPPGVLIVSMLEDRPDILNLIGTRCIIWDSRRQRSRSLASEFHHLMALTDQAQGNSQRVPRPLLLMTHWPEPGTQPENQQSDE